MAVPVPAAPGPEATDRPALTVVTLGRLLWRCAPPVLARLVALTLLVALTELAGALLLAPLLASLGAAAAATGGGGGRASGGHVSRLLRRLVQLGLPPGFDGLLLAYLLVILLYTVGSRQQMTHQIRLGLALVSHLRTRLFGALMRADWSAVIGLRAAEVTHAATTAQAHALVAAQQYGAMLSALGVSLLYAVACLALAPGLTLMAVVGGLLPLLLGRRRRRLAALNRAAHEATTHYQANIHDTLQGLRHVRTHGLEADTLAVLRAADADAAGRRRAALAAADQGRVGQLFGGSLALAGVLELAVHGLAVSVADVLVLVFVFLRLWPRLGRLQQALAQIGHELPFVDRVLKLTARLEASVQRLPPPRPVAAPRHDIALRTVSLAYRRPRENPPGGAAEAGAHPVVADTRWVLEDFTLELPVGRITALVGPSGVGKSTCADLLAGLLVPDRGCLALDGCPLDAAQRAGWRARVTSIGADSLLLHASIRDNLCFGLHPAPPDDALWQALERAGASFAREWPQGLATSVGERAGHLSGGQRQRLALARAWLRPASLLILDEATSALDAETEAAVFASLRAHPPAPTILVISHRDSVRGFADRLVEWPPLPLLAGVR